MEVDCREGADEHVVHLLGRPGSMLSLHTAKSETHLNHTAFVDTITANQVGAFICKINERNSSKLILELACCMCVHAGHFQCGDQAEPVPGPPAALLLECAAVRPHPLREVLQRCVGP